MPRGPTGPRGVKGAQGHTRWRRTHRTSGPAWTSRDRGQCEAPREPEAPGVPPGDRASSRQRAGNPRSG